jgi:hypothetical protein
MTTATPPASDTTDRTRLPDRDHLRLGTAALLAGLVSQIPLGALHPHREYPNDSVAAFHEYAHSDAWVLVHLGQFLGLLTVTVGLLVIAGSLVRQRGIVGLLGLTAGVAAVVSAAVFAVQMAVDGVALKAAVDGWEAATGMTDRAAAYRVADSVRSVEKGLSALFNLTNGLTLLTLGVGLGIGRSAGRRLGLLAAAAGAGLLSVGVITAQTGFSRLASSVALPATGALLVFAVGMVVASWRRPTG